MSSSLLRGTIAKLKCYAIYGKVNICTSCAFCTKVHQYLDAKVGSTNPAFVISDKCRETLGIILGDALMCFVC